MEFVDWLIKNKKIRAPVANKSLKLRKMAAHRAFDPIWKSKAMRRGQTYSWLARQLGIEKHKCHIGMFDENTCRKVVEVCRELRKGEPLL